jgi:DNA-directed RNA polymerase II subunit RPB1
MISCLGQQNVDGKRIPYGFEHRTLPHFSKFDDSPGARGFVESSYINGLSPQELFFHAMGGRVGLIDTAVKTSTTGYIQRRLIKGLEDLMVNYDMTIRTNKNKIVQFAYGDDGIDTTKVENQFIPIVTMSTQDIYAHFNIPDENAKSKLLSNIFLKNTMTRFKKQSQKMNDTCLKYSNMMIEMRSEIIQNVFKKKSDSIVNCPVGFQYIISNIQGQFNINSTSLVDITIVEAFELIEQTYQNLEKIHYVAPTLLFKTLYYYYLSPKDLLIVKRFNKDALMLLLSTIVMDYKRAIVAPGEMVGMIAGQSIGEISTQMTLNTFHFAGVASKSNVTRGVPRIEEILSLSSEPKNPSLTIYLKEEEETQKEKAQTIMYMIEHTKLVEIVKSIEICFDPDDLNTLISEDKDTIQQYRAFESMVASCAEVNLANDENEKSKWIIRMEMDPEIMLEKNITMDDVNFTLNNCYENQINCVYSDYNADKLVFRIRMNEVIKNNSGKSAGAKTKLPLDQSDQIYILKNFQDQLLQNVVLRGIKGINKVILRKIKDNVVEKNGLYKREDIWVLDTVGTNLLEILGIDYIDNTRTFSNDIVEIYNVLGIEAARQSIYNELVDVIEFDGAYVNYHNYSVLVDRMTFTNKMISIFRHGINNDNIGPIAKASFEETPEMFLKAARHAELDTLKGISANVMCGQEGFFGTSAFQVVLDIDEMIKMEAAAEYKNVDVVEEIDKFFGNIDNPNDTCSVNKISIQNNAISIKPKDMGEDNDYNPGF